jgi:hypothetical protein
VAWLWPGRRMRARMPLQALSDLRFYAPASRPIDNRPQLTKLPHTRMVPIARSVGPKWKVPL